MEFSNSLAMRLRRAYMSMHRYAQAYFAPFGVTADQYVVLCLLAEEDDLRQGELADRACSDANTITAMLNLLEQKEIIRRRADTTDARAKRVFLTPQGRRLQKRILESVEPIHAAMELAVSGNRKRFNDNLQAIEKTVANFQDQDALAG